MRYLYDQYSGKVMAVARRYGTLQHRTDDIFQDAFIHIFQQLPKYDPKRGELGAWIYRLSVNVALKLIQKESRTTPVEQEAFEEIQCSDVEALSQLSIEELYQVIEKLPEGQRLVVNLYIIEGYSHREIAELLKITESTSKSQLSRAKSSLVKMITKLNKETIAKR